jgi:hypothetical protein
MEDFPKSGAGRRRRGRRVSFQMIEGKPRPEPWFRLANDGLSFDPAFLNCGSDPIYRGR